MTCLCRSGKRSIFVPRSSPLLGCCAMLRVGTLCTVPALRSSHRSISLFLQRISLDLSPVLGASVRRGFSVLRWVFGAQVSRWSLASRFTFQAS